MRSVLGSPNRARVTRRVGLSGALAAALLLAIGLGAAPASLAQDSQRAEHEFERASSREELRTAVRCGRRCHQEELLGQGPPRRAELAGRMRGERAGVAALAGPARGGPPHQSAARRAQDLAYRPADARRRRLLCAARRVRAQPPLRRHRHLHRAHRRARFHRSAAGRLSGRPGRPQGRRRDRQRGWRALPSDPLVPRQRRQGRSRRGSPQRGRPYHVGRCRRGQHRCLSRRSATPRWPARGSSSRTAAASATCTCGPPSATCRRWCRNPWSGWASPVVRPQEGPSPSRLSTR